MKGRQLDLEQAIRETSDRRARHDRANREAGLVRVNVWVPESVAADLRDLAGRLREGDPLVVERLRQAATCARLSAPLDVDLSV